MRADDSQVEGVLALVCCRVAAGRAMVRGKPRRRASFSRLHSASDQSRPNIFKLGKPLKQPRHPHSVVLTGQTVRVLHRVGGLGRLSRRLHLLPTSTLPTSTCDVPTESVETSLRTQAASSRVPGVRGAQDQVRACSRSHILRCVCNPRYCVSRSALLAALCSDVGPERRADASAGPAAPEWRRRLPAGRRHPKGGSSTSLIFDLVLDLQLGSCSTSSRPSCRIETSA